MATSFQSFIDRENISNPILKTNSKSIQSQKGFHAKAFGDRNAPLTTPRKALGDLGNLQHGTAKKIQSTKPSRVKIFEDASRTNQKKSKVKTKRKPLNQLNENSLPDIEKMIPFIDQENDIPRSKSMQRLLENPRIYQPSLICPPKMFTNFDPDRPKIFSSVYELDTATYTYDDTMANIIGYDDKLELTPVETLPELESILF